MPLPLIRSTKDLAELIGISSDYLYRLSKKTEMFYRKFTLRKKTRGIRRIYAPHRSLKGVQRWILKKILEHAPAEPQAKGFVKGESIKSNASIHVNNKFVLNIDLKDFFPSIKRHQILNVFYSLGYENEVAATLANLTTLDGKLPQGGVTSPYLSNLVMKLLDRRLTGLCNKHALNYSRYADDITISGKYTPDFLMPRIKKIIASSGFQINNHKVRIIRKSSRQIVTGLVVNEQVSIPRNQRRIYRAIFHKATIDPQRFINRLAELKGYMSYLYMVHPASQWIPKWKETIKKIEALNALSS